ncbi:hypothetical protein SS50377_26689 [Spironucleus salmonicida]|uniref:Uncharacterized protein n=1 Tax=Spironucleus salmonicida TaxID=348837 RepID=V6LY60_9EUKA|nr:hypothetical protein SS50377_26689 [Spironucleus salmonicida]|eukprot:EST49163.1 Hypothetical protein SS50377_10376 [Spironucleus salmonicida]
MTIQLPAIKRNKSFTDNEIQAKRIITESILDILNPQPIDPISKVPEKQKAIIRLFGNTNLYTTSFVKLCNRNYGLPVNKEQIFQNQKVRQQLLKEKFESSEQKRKEKIYNLNI